MVVLVSHEIAQRGWNYVQEGEVCKIPGVGPISPGAAREIASDAFLSGLFYDGTDLRHFRRWTRNTPVEVLLALQLGESPEFDGVKCIDCGRRFRNEKEHRRLMSVEAWRRPPISSGVAMGAIRRRPPKIGERGSSRLRTRMPSGARRGCEG